MFVGIYLLRESLPMYHLSEKELNNHWAEWKRQCIYYQQRPQLIFSYLVERRESFSFRVITEPCIRACRWMRLYQVSGGKQVLFSVDNTHFSWRRRTTTTNGTSRCLDEQRSRTTTTLVSEKTNDFDVDGILNSTDRCLVRCNTPPTLHASLKKQSIFTKLTFW